MSAKAGEPLVVELGGREAVAICASLLGGAGAEVVRIRPAGPCRPSDALGPMMSQGKAELDLDLATEEGRACLRDLLSRADVILTSGDLDPDWLDDFMPRAGQILCDIRGSLGSGDLPDAPAPGEWQLQAASGMVYTTGWPDAPPLPIALPVISYSAAFYAAAAVLCRLVSPAPDGAASRIKVSMLEAGFVTMNSYLAGVLQDGGCDPQRVGNRHTAVAPWNSYPARDGEIIICAGNQSQWVALCWVMGREDLARAYPDQASRLAHVERIDQAIAVWSRQHLAATCESVLLAAGIAAGRIVHIDGHPRDQNLILRGLILEEAGSDGRRHYRPALPLGLRRDVVAQPRAVEIIARHSPKPRAHATSPQSEMPLRGLKVIEMGQFTTAPLCGRILASLGAEVIKIEKPGGDEQRGWRQGDVSISETFWLNNTGKRSVCLDLALSEDRAQLETLLATSDLLVENFKPGTLAKFDLAAERLKAINPGLVHCAISGFGARSAYPGRPGFDMVIQGMSGFMAGVAPGRAPVKSGISAADMMGAVAALVASLAALARRGKNGRGEAIDLSMQDVTAWLTATLWNHGTGLAPLPQMLAASDGHVMVEAEAPLPPMPEASLWDRKTLARHLGDKGLTATPVLSLREAAFSPALRDSGIWRLYPFEGRDFPVLGLPFRIDGQASLKFASAPLLEGDQQGEDTQSVPAC